MLSKRFFLGGGERGEVLGRGKEGPIIVHYLFGFLESSGRLISVFCPSNLDADQSTVSHFLGSSKHLYS